MSSCAFVRYIFLECFNSKRFIKKNATTLQRNFFTITPPYKTFKIITAFAKQKGHQIDDIDEQQLALILNERMSMTSWGSLYPIYISEQIVGRTMIEVGITSKLGKFFQISPVSKKINTLRLDNMLNAIQDAVLTDDSVN